MLNHCVVHLKLIYCKPTILPLKIQLVHQISLWTKVPRFLANTHIHTSLIRIFYFFFFFNMEVVVSLQCNIDPFQSCQGSSPSKSFMFLDSVPPKSQVKEANLGITTIYTFLNAFFLPYLRHHPSTQNCHHMTIFGETCTTLPGESHRVSWTMKKWHRDLHRPRVSLPRVLRRIHIFGVPLVMLRPEGSSEDDTVPSVLWQNVWQMVAGELWQVHHGRLMNPLHWPRPRNLQQSPGCPRNVLWQLWAWWCAPSGLPRSGHSLLEESPIFMRPRKWQLNPKPLPPRAMPLSGRTQDAPVYFQEEEKAKFKATMGSTNLAAPL